ncbi:MAG: glycosyltransferase family 39 protein [Oscillospiraceae bacterium]|nr:glycosyltransferase family 39 protein [Oscillospiraceae bacterium]
MKHKNSLKQIDFMNLVGKHPYLLTIVICLLLVVVYPDSQTEWFLPFLTPAQFWILLALPLLLAGGIYIYIRKKLDDRLTALLLMGMGFCMRVGYILATPYYRRQHDVGHLTDGDGHAGYIAYLYENLHLPDFDVREVWQFYHPPLHHSIAAAWMRLQTACGISFEHAGEGVQLLTLGYSCLCMVIFYRILRHFRLNGAAMAIPLAIIAFHPTFILLSGSINNDILSITFMLASVLLTLQWYRNPRPLTILKLALTIGLGMLTKLSAWMVAPAAATAFLIVLYRNRRKPIPYIGQFAMFGVVCIPLGLGWGIRNLLGWGVPITYVPMLSSNSVQYVGNISVLQRILDFSPKQWLYVYDCFEMYGQAYNEYNPLIGLFKTAMFDELINTENFPKILGFGETLFFSQILLAVLSAAAIIGVYRRQSTRIDKHEKLMLIMTYGITLLSYYSFCIIFAHVCTQNIRYATPLIFIGCLFLGLRMRSKQHTRPLRIGAGAATAIFAAVSCIVYACVCCI